MAQASDNYPDAGGLPYLSRILSSDVDVDRADFIMRDTHHSGVAYGRFDLNWLLSTATLGHQSNGQIVFGFDERKAVRVIEQFLIARQAMYDTVYHHKAVRCIEGMISLFLRRIKELVLAGSRPPMMEIVLPAIQVMQGKALGPAELVRLDDFVIFVLIDQVAQGVFSDDTARDLAKRIQARDLFKQVPVSSDEIGTFLANPGNADKLYDVVKPFVPGLSTFFVYVDQARFQMLSSVPSHQAMLVARNGQADRAAEHSSLRHYYQPARNVTRIFTVAQAVDAVRRLIAKSH